MHGIHFQMRRNHIQDTFNKDCSLRSARPSEYSIWSHVRFTNEPIKFHIWNFVGIVDVDQSPLDSLPDLPGQIKEYVWRKMR